MNLKKKIIIKKEISNYYSFDYKKSKMQLIKYNNNKVLLLFNELSISLFDITLLKIIKYLNFEFFEEQNFENCLQINNDELLITSTNNIYIINLKANQIKLTFTYESYIIHIFKLYDDSIVVCGQTSAKRISSKTFEIIELFYYVRDEGEVDSHTLEYFSFYNYIINCIQINKSKILCILKDDNCRLYEISI